MTKKLLASASILLLATATLAEQPPGPPVTEPVDVNVIDTVDVNVISEPDQSISSSDFRAFPQSCSGDEFTPCLARRTIEGEGFLLHYIILEVNGDDSSPTMGCTGSALIAVLQDNTGFSGYTLLRVRTEPNSRSREILTLPTPIRLKAGDEIRGAANSNFGGLGCGVTATFGGEQL